LTKSRCADGQYNTTKYVNFCTLLIRNVSLYRAPGLTHKYGWKYLAATTSLVFHIRTIVLL